MKQRDLGDRMYDFLAAYQPVVMGLAILLILLPVSFTISANEINLVLKNDPLLIIAILGLGLLLIMIYIMLDKKKIRNLSMAIGDISKSPSQIREESLKALTQRQKEVYELIVSGHSNKEICTELYIEQSTLKSHINQIYRKLKIKKRSELRS